MILTNKMKKPVPLSDDYLKAIGNITVVFSLLSFHIELFIWNLIGGDFKNGRAITARIRSFEQLTAMLSALYRNKVDDGKLIGELEDVLKKAGTLAQNRNSYAHSVWGAGEENALLFNSTAKVKKGLIDQTKKVSIQDLEQFSNEIADVAQEVHTIMNNTIKAIRGTLDQGRTA